MRSLRSLASMPTGNVPTDRTAFVCRDCAAVWDKPALEHLGGMRLTVRCDTCLTPAPPEPIDVAAQVRRTMVSVGVPVQYLDATLERGHQRQQDAIDAIQAWLVRRTGELLLTGSVGCGKSYLAMAAARAIVDRGERVRVAEMLPLGRKLQAAFRQDSSEDEVLEPYLVVSWLVLDDLGAGIVSDVIRRSVLALIDERQNAKLSTLVTCNFGLDWIAERLDERIASRLSAGTVVTMDGPDLRGVVIV